MFIQPANEGVNAANSKHGLRRLDLSSIGTTSNKVVVAVFNTDQKSQRLNGLQAGFGYVEAFGYLSISATFSLTFPAAMHFAMHLLFCL